MIPQFRSKLGFRTVSKISNVSGPERKPEGNARALFSRGIDADNIVSAPFDTPELPMPAIALPTINILEEVETPHTNEPSSKRAIKAMYVYYNIISSGRSG